MLKSSESTHDNGSSQYPFKRLEQDVDSTLTTSKLMVHVALEIAPVGSCGLPRLEAPRQLIVPCCSGSCPSLGGYIWRVGTDKRLILTSVTRCMACGDACHK